MRDWLYVIYYWCLIKNFHLDWIFSGEQMVAQQLRLNWKVSDEHL